VRTACAAPASYRDLFVDQQRRAQREHVVRHDHRSADGHADRVRQAVEVRRDQDAASERLFRVAEIAVNAMLAFALPAGDGKPVLRAAWDVAIPTGQYRYYDGCLYMLSLLHLSGKFNLF
jgi:hypothetical protein